MVEPVGNATGVEVPAEVVDALGSGRRPKVVITIGGHTWRSRVAGHDQHAIARMRRPQSGQVLPEHPLRPQPSRRDDRHRDQPRPPDGLRRAQPRRHVLAIHEPHMDPGTGGMTALACSSSPTSFPVMPGEKSVSSSLRASAVTS